ncbi:LLM class flavin-dependent oxidoreductase [Pigmentiphaga aceris]|uniref:LLM class flavin-dependent oxidoreductase n=1 Tax=Pigmentiphaga aceris TaxID=1940612 RepID=A0A5C0B0L6_9BURK|nr:LLM class flavin-dependent oxidoreductase [Pigmentiphaga aceris]QEI08192.1 LLM class flavin-dependent oxidoreductase [Pigmentiphaga aceris]
MSIHLHWYLPTNGDSRDIVGSGDDSHRIDGVAGAFRPATLDYLKQVAGTAETLGFEAALTPTGTWCEDAWITTAALSQHARRLKFLVAFRPGFISPTLAAHQAASFQRLTEGRLLINIVTGGDPVEQRRFGDHADHAQRYARTGEFLQVFRQLGERAGSGKAVDFQGEHYQIEGANLLASPYAPPPVFFGGASPAAEQVAAQYADTYLAWGETPRQIGERFERVQGLARQHGRSLEYGIRLHVISRDTEAQAWEQAERLQSAVSPERVREALALFSRTESVGQQRMTALVSKLGADAVGRSARNLEISPNLWAGYGLVRGGAGTALVGSHAQVAERIAEYHALGLTHFILSGQPHIEEAYWFAEGAGAILRKRGLWTPA